MPDLNCSDSKDRVTETLPPDYDQPGEQTHLLPFSGKLGVDLELKLKNESFKPTIHDYYKFKNITPLSQLTATPPFPTPHVLAQFASKAYTDYEEKETNAQYETRLALPDDWKLLTTASNSSRANGYFGAAYWHPEHQQVVIAHRGTDPTNVGALWTDLSGVLLNHYVRQMGSACTFAHKVVEVLQSVNETEGVSLQLFFTGHSLGGWLAQITNFTTKYLKVANNTFLNGDKVPQSYHPHTVVFNSPGCQDMLLQMADKLDVRLDGRSIDIEKLDITSYLSAPNRINTCNKHVGTVYRIFPDFSNMSWLATHTAFYNFEAHSMQKIVDFFNPREGQVHKGQQGERNILLVNDWPISAGFRRGKEYKRLFKWAKHLNEYHQEVTDLTFKVKGYHPLRYQTKTYDERVCRLSVFCQEEQLFLERYLWLRQLQGFFKPKAIFSLMEENRAQEQAEEILQCFEIENDKIRCTDGRALQALIPYVKRLLQLFPEIKYKAKLALSSDEVRNKIYQIETKRYVERINQSSLEFNSDSLSFREFLENEKQKVLHLQMDRGDEWTGLIKVHQVLQKNGRLREGQYIVLNIERLLTVNQMMNIGELMQSTVTPYLLLIACEDNQQLDEETKDVITKLFDKIKQKPNIKIIFITRLEGSIVQFLHDRHRELSGNGFVRRVEQLTWTDLTTNSQEKVLQKSVKFQGAKISLKQLIFAESPIAKFLDFDALLEEKELQIADPVQVSNGYDESYYIDRIFRIERVIKQGIFNEHSRDYLARSEKEYKQLCQQNPKSNVHWLEEDKAGNLVWQQSQGSLETVRKYIDIDRPHTYTDGDLVKLLEQAEHKRVMLISDTAGMGKSTVLTHLSKIIKRRSPAKWVVRIDLNDHTDVLKVLKEEQIDSTKVIEFVSEKLLKLKPGLEMELFKQCCEKEQKVRIVIMLDGFDEVSPFYKETVYGLLQALRQTEVEQLWVTTRPHLRDELEDKLQQLSFTLQPFSEENQVEFLTQFWRLKDWFIEPEGKVKEIKKNKIEIYAEHLIKKLANSITDKDREFTGIPLQTRMLAEAFDGEVKIFYVSSEPMPDLPLKLDLLELYCRFIERKYDIYQEEKCQINVNIVGATEQRERDLKITRQEHQLLAMKMLFTEEQVAFFQNSNQCTFSVEKLRRFGLVYLSHEGKPHFIHRTFAEYYVANFFVNNTSQKVQDFILKDIFLKEEYRVVRVFIDGLLSRSKPSKDMSIQYGIRIDDLGNVCVLHTAASEGNANIIKFMLESARAGGHRDKVIGLLLGQDEGKRTAWFLAAASGELEVLEIISVWAKENLTRDEIRKQLLFATDRYQNTVWHLTAFRGNQDVLQKICDFAKEYLSAEDIKNKLFFAKDRYGNTAWNLAVFRGNQDIVQKIRDVAKDYLTAEEIKNMLLLARDIDGNTAWHLAAFQRNQDVLQKICDFAKDYLTAEETKNMCFFATNRYGNTAWHLAAKENNQDVLQKICDFAKEYRTADEINKILFLAKDRYGNTAWHLAAKRGNQDVLQKICDLAKGYLTTEEIKNKFFLATDIDGNTAWHLVAKWSNQDVLQKICDMAKEYLTTEEIKNMIFSSKNRYQNTAWHLVAKWGKQDVLQKICDLAKDYLTAAEIKDMLFLDTDRYQNTAWHMAAFQGNKYVLQEICNFAKDNLTSEEIKNTLFLATDINGNTAWHLAAKGGKQDQLQKIWDLAKENLTTEEIKNKLFLAKDRYRNTAWHLVAFRGNQDVLQKICDFAENYLTVDEIKNKLFLATDSDGNTAWHLAAKGGKQDVLQKIWDFAKKNLTAEEIKDTLFLATDSDGNNAWHLAAKGGKQDVLQKIRDFAKDNLSAEEIKNTLFFTTDSERNTAWHLAAKWGKHDVLQKICDLAKDYLTAEEIKNMLFLGTGRYQNTAWHMAAFQGNEYVLQKICDFAKENLTAEEIKHSLFLATEGDGNTAWHLAAKGGKLDVLQKIWDFAKENLTAEEIKNTLFLATDSDGNTAWHLAAKGGKQDVIQKIWDFAKYNLTAEEIKNTLFFTTDSERNTAWHLAAKWGNQDVLQIICDLAKDYLTTEEIKCKLLLATDRYGNTAWPMAAFRDFQYVLQKICDFAKDTLTVAEIKNTLFLATDRYGNTAWHLAAKESNRDVLQKICYFAKENLTAEEIKKKVFLDTDSDGNTVWRLSARLCNQALVQKICDFADDNLTTEEIKNQQF